MSYLCTTKNGNDEKMYFKCLKHNSGRILVKIIDKNDKLLSKEIVGMEKFKQIYEPLIEFQLNHLYRFEFWESL